MANGKVPKNYTEIDFDKFDKEIIKENFKSITTGIWHNTIVQEPPVHKTLLVWDDVYCKYRLCGVNDFVAYWTENDTNAQIPFRHTYWQALAEPDGLQDW